MRNIYLIENNAGGLMMLNENGEGYIDYEQSDNGLVINDMMAMASGSDDDWTLEKHDFGCLDDAIEGGAGNIIARYDHILDEMTVYFGRMGTAGRRAIYRY